MPSQYAPKQFLRQAEPGLLRKYFASKGALTELDWAAMEASEIDVEAVFSAWQALPEKSQQEIEQDFRDIHELATADGIRTIIEEGQVHDVDLAAELEPCAGFLNKALHVFLNHRRIFEVSGYFDHADNLNGRSWRTRKDMPKKRPDVSQESLAQLAAAIKSYFQENQGRGENCEVDTYFRGRRRNYFFAYPQDYVDTFIGYDADGKLKRRPHNPAFEIVFIYDAEEGTLDLYAPGDKTVKQDLQKLFTRTVLHEDLGEENAAAAAFQLNGLKQRAFGFRTDPEDGITDVRVREMRLSLVGSPHRRITLDAGAKGAKEDIHELIESSLDKQQLPLSMVEVTSAVIQMQFANTTGRGRPQRTLTFRVSHPDSCNLKADRPEHLKARKCLKLSEIERA